MVSTVYIAKNVYGGDGLGRLGDGRVVFVPGAFAGESVKAEIVEEKRHFVRARLVEVVEPSPDRVEPGPVVPGMVYSALSYDGECRAKESQLREFLDRARIPVGGFAADPGMSASPALNYRSKVVYHFARQNGDWVIGYRREPAHDIVDVSNDPLARPEINAALGEIRRGVLTLLTQGPEAVRRDTARKAKITVRWSGRSGVKWWIGDAPDGVVVKETTCGKVFEVPADGFYQVNPVVGERLVKAVVDEYARCGGDMVDLYCGVGVFGLCCRPPRLVGVESGRQAVDFARRNAESQGFASAKFFAEQVGRSLRRIKVGPGTAVVVDPPRGGMEPNVPAWLADCGAARIFYVSCDPATMTRDLKTICRGYDVESVRWFNMFPRTARFETLACLRRK